LGVIVNLDSSTKQCVGFLYADDFDDDNGLIIKKPFGTCFFIYAATPRDGWVFYLVTAKHVLRKMQATATGPMYVRLNKKEEQGVYYHPLPRDGWHEHEDTSVDAAILQIHLPFEKGTSGQFLAVNFSAVLETPDLVPKNEPGHQWPPREGEEICVVALFLQHPGQERNYPVFRFGHISLMSDERIDGEYGPSEYHLIENQVYRGHSGAPVFVHYGSLHLYLFGILAAAYPSEEEIRSVPDRAEKYYNLGISKVVPIQKVVDILNQEDLRKQREEAGG
jgi:hypothetical protein